VTTLFDDYKSRTRYRLRHLLVVNQRGQHVVPPAQYQAWNIDLLQNIATVRSPDDGLLLANKSLDSGTLSHRTHDIDQGRIVHSRRMNQQWKHASGNRLKSACSLRKPHEIITALGFLRRIGNRARIE
jgi:hypothetical protein